MQVSVTFRNMPASEALKEYATEKIERLQKYLRRPMDAHVILFRERMNHVAEIVLSANGTVLKGLAKDGDMYAAIDEAHGKLDVQMRRLKEKRRDHRPSDTVRTPRARPERVMPPAPAGRESEAEETGAPVIALEPALAATRAMSAAEAIAEIEKRGLDLLLFKNRQTKRVNVVYRKPDGSFGLVDRTARKK